MSLPKAHRTARSHVVPRHPQGQGSLSKLGSKRFKKPGERQLTVIQVGQQSGDHDGNALAVGSGSRFEVNTKILIWRVLANTESS